MNSGILLLTINVFLSAFLLFQSELILAKLILPIYGGSYLVWGACMVFFQAVLLLGYLFSHYVIRHIGIGRYRYAHLGLMLLPLLFFPGRDLIVSEPNPHIPLFLDVFWQLVKSIGPVFFVLSTMSIILQAWLAGSSLPEKKNPYTLYSVSNLGSFLALLSYPLFIEEVFDLNTQLFMWRIGYFAMVAVGGLMLWRIKSKGERVAAGAAVAAIAGNDRLRWFLYGMAGVVMFLAVTNVLTSEVAPIPLLWVIPLGIYLLSFVLNFKAKPWCPNWVKNGIPQIIGYSILLFFVSYSRDFLPYGVVIILYIALLFGICMFCQYELARTKPQDERNLTTYYVFISLGGFAGGILTSWIMPFVSDTLLEYLIGLWIITYALNVGRKKEFVGLENLRIITYLVAVLLMWPMAFKGYHVFGFVALLYLIFVIFKLLNRNPRALFLCLIPVLALSLIAESLWMKIHYVVKERNFYGIHKVYERVGIRFLMHATTVHGGQYLDVRRRHEPILYYHPRSPITDLMRTDNRTFKSIGAVGLGTGALVVNIREGQSMDYFELDPDIESIARGYFTFLKDALGPVQVFIGDARRRLAELKEKSYDLIIVDAFSGDAIPVHLLTIEAIELYKQRLAKDGIIIFHISNRYVDLIPVLTSAAYALDAHVCFKNSVELKDNIFPSNWITLTWDPGNVKMLTEKHHWMILGPAFSKYMRPWTDQYSPILLTFKWNTITDSIKNFRPFYW